MAQEQTTVLELPSGAKAEISRYKGRHIRAAQLAANGDSSLLLFAIIANTAKIDGRAIVMEDLDEMDGADVMALMGHFGSNFQ